MIHDKSIIQYFLFDFGAVLYEINPEILINNFKSFMQVQNKSNALEFRDLMHMDIFDNFETGRLSPDAFRTMMCDTFNLELSSSNFDNVWNSILIKPYFDILDFAMQLRSNYQICLLSNTNEIHYHHFYPECKEYIERFHAQYYSFKLGMRKPNILIFRYILEVLNVPPEKILFIDDTKSNIVSAEQLGFQTFHFNYNTNKHILIDAFLYM